MEELDDVLLSVTHLQHKSGLLVAKQVYITQPAQTTAHV